MTQRRLGAYILPGDPVWLAKTLASYYPILDDLVIPIPVDGVGWAGTAIPVDDVLTIVNLVDHRGILRTVDGQWTDREHPMRADTAQRQAALNAMVGRVDWVLQLDNDEFLPHPASLADVLSHAEKTSQSAVEWPMRVLYRRTSKWIYEVVDEDGSARYDYPGPIAVRPDVRLVDARRIDGSYLRAVVAGDESSLQLRRPAEAGETRWAGLNPEDAIVHNSWARSPREVWRKTRSWGHADGLRSVLYFAVRWFPSPLTWRRMRDLHPFARGLWPRLARRTPTPELTDVDR